MRHRHEIELTMNNEETYQRLPVALQNLACSVEGWRLRRRRYNDEYEAISRILREHPCSSDSIMQALQKPRLQAHLNEALHSPYWKAQFERYKINVHADSPLDELQKLSILTKAEVQADSGRIRPRDGGVWSTGRWFGSGCSGWPPESESRRAIQTDGHER